MIKPGSIIVAIAPSGVVNRERIQAGAEVLERWGYRVELPEALWARHRYLAGTDAHRAAAVVDAFERGDAVWMARGGFGLARVFKHLPSLPTKPIFGFSDGTALINREGGVHAPVLNSLVDHVDIGSLVALRDLLEGRPQPLVGTTWQAGVANAQVVGGNLCVLASLCGTSRQINARGRILALEDIGEAPYKVDRMLTQLVQSGAVTGVHGIALGKFIQCEAPDGSDWTLGDVLRERLLPLGVPIVADLPFGHGAQNHAFPIGQARLGDGALSPLVT